MLFSHTSQRWQQLIPQIRGYTALKKHLRDVDVSQTCVSSKKKLILARIGLFEDYEGREFTVCLKYHAKLGVRFRPSGS